MIPLAIMVLIYSVLGIVICVGISIGEGNVEHAKARAWQRGREFGRAEAEQQIVGGVTRAEAAHFSKS